MGTAGCSADPSSGSGVSDWNVMPVRAPLIQKLIIIKILPLYKGVSFQNSEFREAFHYMAGSWEIWDMGPLLPLLDPGPSGVGPPGATSWPGLRAAAHHSLSLTWALHWWVGGS